MMQEIHQNDIGTRFILTVKENNNVIDLSTASQIDLIFKTPSKSVFTRTASLLNNGADGKIFYDTIQDDLSEVGMYKIQAKVFFLNGTFNSVVHSFQVHCNL
jgi:hypothetical protein